MDIGMLWFDNDPSTSFPQKIERASSYYHRKYGKDPDICFVHPSMLGAREGMERKKTGGDEVGGLVVEESERVLPHHFWIGISSREKIS